jgi:hypothetical protein
MANGGIIGPINDPTSTTFTVNSTTQTFTASGTFTSQTGQNKVDYLKGETKKGQSLKIKFSNNCISKNIFSIKSTTTKKKSLVLENRSANYHGNFIIYNKNNFKKKNIIFKDISQNSNNSRIICSRLVIKDLIKSFYKKDYSLFNDLEHAVKVHQIISNI